LGSRHTGALAGFRESFFMAEERGKGRGGKEREGKGEAGEKRERDSG